MLRRCFTPSHLIPFLCGGCLSSRRQLVVGNSKNGTKPVASVDWTDLVGKELWSENRLAAGELLAMMDLCAKRVSEVYLSSMKPRVSCSTVGVSTTTFYSPVLHGDVVRMHGRLIYCGSSSMGIHIRFYRRSPSTITESLTGESYFTMVAIDENLRAVKTVPAVELTDENDVSYHNGYLAARNIAAEAKKISSDLQKKSITCSDVECTVNAAKPIRVPIASTRTSAHRIFLLYHLNNNRTIFGGELMRWMERHAVHCGRMFTGNRHISTVAMHNVEFHHPVFGTDWVTLEADIIYVHNTTMEVDVKLVVERDGHVVTTNRASFVLINLNEIGQKTIIPKGLDLSAATEEELLRFAEAKERYRRSRNNRR